MFTGLVEEIGEVRRSDGARVRIHAPAVSEGLAVGASVAVDGCCLTVVDHGDGWWEADVSAETRLRTTLAGLQPGDQVNLERPLRLADRLGGHLVQGHVDGVGKVLRSPPELRVGLSSALARYLVAKGSVAVDGVSLTVVAAGSDSFTAAVIPHTAQATTLGSKAPGAQVNLEVDLVAKYVERLVTRS